jgi:hypothetical protein
MFLALSSLVAIQTFESQAVSPARVPVSTTVVDRGADPHPPSFNELVTDVEMIEGSTAELDDLPPLPVPEVVEPGPGGDVVVAPASGDPFFLGFVAGSHYPAADERIDPALLAAVRAQYDDGRPADETYAFVMFSKRITESRKALLADLGVRVLEFHPHYTLKVALPPLAIDAVAALDFVRWIGAAQSWQKVHPMMESFVAERRPGAPIECYVNVFDSDLNEASTWRAIGTAEYNTPDGVVQVADSEYAPKAWMSNGWQQRALQSMGIDVREYVDSIRAFRVLLQPESIEQLVGLDFVQFVEPLPPKTVGHDESMPMVHLDKTRITYNGGANNAAVAGEVDSGIYYAHNAINGYYWWASNFTGEASTDDFCLHGTHVAGTIHGDGDVEDSYEGAANGLGGTTTTRFFNTKLFSGAACSYASGTSMASILDATDGAVTDGSGNVTPRAMVVNHSWGSGSTSGGYSGTEADCRTIDNSVFVYDQLQCFIAHNHGPAASTTSQQGSAKNSFTVGGVIDYRNGSLDPGEMYSASGRGPTGDARWKPNVTAPGQWITSTRAHTATGYLTYNGTSMAAPHVTGLASQLVDHIPFLRHNAPTLGALLMASATTKNNQLLTSEADTHLDNWGAGRIQAWRAHAFTGATYVYRWTGTGYVYADVPVNSGATRIVACMWYTEAAASSGASQALVNNYNLYLDAPPISATGNVGEYTTQQSNRDNTEIRILDNPTVGTWRIKLWPQSVTSTCKLGLAVCVYYDDTTPDPTLTVTANDTFVRPNDAVQVTATYFNPDFIASAVFLDSTSSGDTLLSSSTTLEDGAVSNLLGNQQSGRDVLLGDVAPGDSRQARWTTRWATEGVKSFAVQARSDNAVDKALGATIYVDGTPPSLPTNLQSSTHTPNVWTNDTTITYTWTAATDNLSGIDGYGTFTSTTPGAPGPTKDIEQVTSFNETLAQGSWYFMLRPVDNSGNWNASYVSTGPYRIDTTGPAAPTNLSSPTHQLNTPNCSTVVSVHWTAATDSGGSGLAGYRAVWDTNPIAFPTGAANVAAGATSFTTDIGSGNNARYLHLRAIDAAGNYGTTAHFGPILADSTPVNLYCTAKTNSQGCSPRINTNGASPSKSGGAFAVTCDLVINQKNGLLFYGFAPLAAPFQGGTLCVASPTIRSPSQNSGGSALGADCTGSFSFTFTTAVMNQNGLDVGETIYAQYWYRDPQSPSTTGLSNGLYFTICN